MKWKIFILILGVFFLFGCSDSRLSEELYQKELRLTIGETKAIVTERPNDFLFFATDDDVEVNDLGEVTAKRIGSAVIVIEDQRGKIGTCIVIVTGEKLIPLESLAIVNPLEESYVGQTVKLETDIAPVDADNYEAIVYESSEPDIVTVTRDGQMKTISPGKAVITVKGIGTEISDSFEITVLAKENQVSLNYQDVTGNAGTSDLKLKAHVVTDYRNVGEGVYTSRNPEIASVDQDGNVTFKQVGKTEIDYRITINQEEYLTTCLVTVRDLTGYTVIRTPEQLQEIQNTSGNYALGNDIDMQTACSPGGSLYHGGSGFAPLFANRDLAFIGIFDGQGYAIRNIMINSGVNNTALFGYLSVLQGKEGIIRNLAMIGGSITGENYTSVFAANVGSFTGSPVSGIYNCWTDTEVKSTGPASGFVGMNGGTVKNSFTLSKVTGETSVGAFALRQVNNPDVGIDGCYASVTVNPDLSELLPASALSGNASYLHAELKTEAELKQSTAYSGWDTTIWEIRDGFYPVLKTPYYQE